MMFFRRFNVAAMAAGFLSALILAGTPNEAAAQVSASVSTTVTVTSVSGSNGYCASVTITNPNPFPVKWSGSIYVPGTINFAQANFVSFFTAPAGANERTAYGISGASGSTTLGANASDNSLYFCATTVQSSNRPNVGPTAYGQSYPALATCTPPWGGTPVIDGATITAYQASTVTAPASCASQTLTCNAATGTFSGGSYTNQFCTVVNPPAACNLPWGGTTASGTSVTAYLTNSVTSPATCTAETRTCTNGVLSGSNTNQTCTVSTPAPVKQMSLIPPHLQYQFGAPMTMLDVSRDHQLFKKAYNEYSDFDGDGIPDTQYKNTIDYYGYFDSGKCYAYSASNSRFEPSGTATSHLCSGAWSGNFLNWASMTRMDTVRKILYGGFRSTDTSTLTVLERANLPTDAHAFSKYYKSNSADPTHYPTIDQLTPFTNSNGEISMCNLTLGSSSSSSPDRYSHTNTQPPLLRAAAGNYSLWNDNERWQCYWKEEQNATNQNDPTITGIPASSSNPSKAGLSTTALPAEMVVRVKACDSGYLGTEKCKVYPNGNYKPYGVLQTYGESGLSEFGLFTGTYSNNISGGVLRKNIDTFANEVNTATDGTFITTDSSGNAVKGIVYTLNHLRIYGYDYNDGTYTGLDQCNYGLIGLPEGHCASWGNPIGEIYMESLRYLAGQTTPNSDFSSNAASLGLDATMGLATATWLDPFRTNDAARNAKFGSQVCRPVNAIVFNASVSSYDNGGTTNNQTDYSKGFATISTTTAASYTNAVGAAEGITTAANGKYFIGSPNALATASDGLCSAKTLTNLAFATGLCPEAPTYKGSYLLAGMAYWAHTNPIRTTPTIPSGNTSAFRVNTYGVALATGTPKIVVPVPGSTTGQTITILPAWQLVQSSGNGVGALVDFKIVSQDLTAGTGKFLVQWEDSEQGGDYDQDAWGTIEYSFNSTGTAVYISTAAYFKSTPYLAGFGYIISGTNHDGPHFHSGINGYSYTDSSPPNSVLLSTGGASTHVNSSGGCNACDSGSEKTVATYTVQGTTAKSLNDPLWYAAKYGSFKDSDGNNLPNLISEYAADNSKTNPTNPDPDGYIYAINPAVLDSKLNALLQKTNDTGITAPAVTSSSFVDGDKLFVTRYFSDYSGDVQAYTVSANTTNVLAWSDTAAHQLSVANYDTQRVVMTIDTKGNGQAFRYANLDATLQGYLNTTPSGTTDTNGNLRVNFLRGDSSHEATGSSPLFQSRVSKLGSIINSSPWVLNPPSSTYPQADYFAYRSANINRKPIIFAGANDGMVHGFDVASGKVLISYVPRTLYPILTQLTSPSYTTGSQIPFVDGSPFAADLQINDTNKTWKTYLFGTLGRGGQGIYALDMTNVGDTGGTTTSLAESNASSVVKWEFSDADDADLGNIVGVPNVKEADSQPRQVAKMANGRWAVIFGNGYKSDLSDGTATTGTGRDALFILFVDGPSGVDPLVPGKKKWVAGTDYVKIVPTSSLAAGAGNGLSTPYALDADRDGAIDTIYAGDLRGNLWKFDVSDANPANWGVAFSGAPLYSATSSNTTPQPQPITTAPVVIPHPLGGFLVEFGTGKSLDANDMPTSVTHTFYGLWDRPPTGTTARTSSPVGSGRSRLQGQTATALADGSGLITSNNKITDWTSYDGWYINLILNSESVLTNPFRNGSTNIVFKTDFASSTTTVASCGSSYNGNVYELNGIDGSRADQTFDINGDGSINSSDLVSDGNGNSIVQSSVILSQGTGAVTQVGQGVVVSGVSSNSTSGSSSTSRGVVWSSSGTGLLKIDKFLRDGRIFWREIVKDQ